MREEAEVLKLDNEELEELKELEKRFKAGLCLDCGNLAHPVFRTLCAECATYHGLQVCKLCGEREAGKDEEICYECWLKTDGKEIFEERMGIRIGLEEEYSVIFMRPEKDPGHFFSFFFVVPPEQEPNTTDRLMLQAQAALSREHDSPVSVETFKWIGRQLVETYLQLKDTGASHFYLLSPEVVTALEA